MASLLLQTFTEEVYFFMESALSYLFNPQAL